MTMPRHIAKKGNDNVSDISVEADMADDLLGLSQQTSTQCRSIVENDYELVSYESVAACLTAEIGGGCNRLPCGVESAPTPMPELNCTKWRGLLSGVMQSFAHAEAFKKALYKYSIAHKFEFEFVRNSKDNISVKCKIFGCPWRVTANAIGKTSSLLRVTTFRDEHFHSAQDNLQVSHGGRSNLTSSIIVDEVRNHIEKRPNDYVPTQQYCEVKLFDYAFVKVLSTHSWFFWEMGCCQLCTPVGSYFN